MDLGIRGRHAIICAGSQGLGRACAIAVAQEGVNVCINGRDAKALEKAADDIRRAAPDVSVKTTVGSVTDPAVRAALLDAVPEPDILLNNAGGPPPGNFREFTREMWMAALDQNLYSAVELIRLTIDGMASRGFGRIVNITSSSVRVPIPVIGLSNAARAGLTGFVFGLVPEFSSKGVTLNNLLPGPFNTDRLRKAAQANPSVGQNRVAGRIGEPEELGALFAFLCGTQASYITGQNFLLDGGLNPGNF